MTERSSSDEDEPVSSALDIHDISIDILEYEQKLIVDTIDGDVLFICARGLGVERLLLNHFILYSDPKLLFFVLNASQQDESFFLEKLKRAEVECQPKVINADVSVKDRMTIYLEGGVQFITSRILMTDFLCDRLPVPNISGIIICHAHQVLQNFQESFIIRMFKERKRDGLVKAFTDVPTALSAMGEIQLLIDKLYVRRVRIVPRFDVEVKKTFEDAPVCLSEFSVDVPPKMRQIVAALIELMKVCGRDLKTTVQRAAKKEEDYDAEFESVGGVAYRPTPLERELRNRRGFLTDKQKRLLADLDSLRDLLRTAENMDSCTLLNKVNSIRTDKERVDASGWILSSVAKRLFLDIESVTTEGGNIAEPTVTVPSKWNVFASILEEIKELEVKESELPTSGPSVVVFTSDDQVTRQLADLCRFGIEKLRYMVRRFLPPDSWSKAKSREPLASPLWSPELILPLFWEKESKSGILEDVQTEQKTLARLKRRRRLVADGMHYSDGKVQSNILQFGILHKKARLSSKKTPEGTSEERACTSEGKEDHSTACDKSDASIFTVPKKIGDWSGVPLTIMSHNNKYNIIRQLETLKPTVIILYNTDVVSLRQIEIFKALNAELFLRVFLLQNQNSAEEERYLSAINREQLAFESLTRQQSTLLIAREYDVLRNPPPAIQIISTREGGGASNDPDKRSQIVVDLREFNSELPTVLYKTGFDVVPATLEVGDYVLTANTCVERKALDDLAQSLLSGRIFKQTEQMARNYATIILLIESNKKFSSVLVNGGPFQGELSRHCRDIRLLLCTLIRQYPQLIAIWSPSPANSAEFFTEFKINQPEPDLAMSISMQGDRADNDEADGHQSSKRNLNAVVMRVLREHLFSFQIGDVRRLMLSENITSLQSLFTMDRRTLADSIGESLADRIESLATFDFTVTAP